MNEKQEMSVVLKAQQIVFWGELKNSQKEVAWPLLVDIHTPVFSPRLVPLCSFLIFLSWLDLRIYRFSADWFTIAEREPRQHPPQEGRRETSSGRSEEPFGPFPNFHQKVKVAANNRQLGATFVQLYVLREVWVNCAVFLEKKLSTDAVFWSLKFERG